MPPLVDALCMAVMSCMQYHDSVVHAYMRTAEAQAWGNQEDKRASWRQVGTSKIRTDTHATLKTCHAWDVL